VTFSLLNINTKTQRAALALCVGALTFAIGTTSSPSWANASGLQLAQVPERVLPPGSQTARVQAMLAELGYDPGPADGVSGAKTRSAIRSFESHSGLPITGAVSRTVHDQLTNDLGYAASASPSLPAANTRDSGLRTPSSTPSTGSAPRSETAQPSRRARASKLAGAMNELKGLINDAERRDAADSDVLAELRALVARHSPRNGRREDRPWRTQPSPTPPVRAPKPIGPLVRDTFDDGNYTANPTWRVRSGTFWVDDNRRLRSDVAAAAPAQRTSKEDIPLAILGAILGQQQSSTPQPQSTGGQIYLSAEIPSDFQLRTGLAVGDVDTRVRFSLTSAGRITGTRALEAHFVGGQVTFTLYAQSQQVLGRVTLRTAAKQRSIRELRWLRDGTGKMDVQVNGRSVLSVSDNETGPSFQGIQIAHITGSVGIDFVELTQPALPY
jgi:peptidoglycan hydrolase-like protein with peptidoglycan-binding domain